MNQNMKYDVVVSFAGEDRQYVKKLVGLLKQRGLKVFYDENFQASLWGADLSKTFARIYYEEALFCISVISKAYRDKPWTNYEMKYIRDRQFSKENYLLPLVLEDVEIPGIRLTDGKIYAKDYPMSYIADMVLEKVEHAKKTNNNNEEFENLQVEHPIMTIVDEYGEEEVVEVLLSFEFKDNKNEYVIYTKGERDESNNITVYTSQVDHSEGEPRLLGVSDEEEWLRVKDVLRTISEADFDDIDETFKTTNNSTPLLPIKYDKNGIEIL